MIGFLEGLSVTLKTMLRRPVTAQYPEPAKRLAIADRFMGFPALTWDYEIGEPYCTGCMVCVRDCPTQCMSATMVDNPLHADEKSKRRKIVGMFEINLGRCILCGICVDVCNFDAIEMGHEHELSKYERNDNRVDLQELLVMGKQYQTKMAWKPKQPEKNSGVFVKKEAKSKVKAPAGTAQDRQAATNDTEGSPTAAQGESGAGQHPDGEVKEEGAGR